MEKRWLRGFRDSSSGGGDSTPPSGAASGDLGGTYPGPEVTGLLGQTLPATAADGLLKRNAADNAWLITKNPGHGALTTSTPAGTTQTINWNSGIIQKLSLATATGDVTLTLTNPANTARYTLVIVQGAVVRNVVWPITVIWPAGVPPVISVANGAIDKIELTWDGTTYYGTFAQAMA